IKNPTSQVRMTMTEEPLADARDMFAVHTMFRREFGLMPGLIRGTAADTGRAAVVAAHVALVAEVLHLHHTGEDVSNGSFPSSIVT
ncbi:MAG TPA: hypothetical protein VIZ43_29515, partial [Trebonia sp.]